MCPNTPLTSTTTSESLINDLKQAPAEKNQLQKRSERNERKIKSLQPRGHAIYFSKAKEAKEPELVFLQNEVQPTYTNDIPGALKALSRGPIPALPTIKDVPRVIINDSPAVATPAVTTAAAPKKNALKTLQRQGMKFHQITRLDYVQPLKYGIQISTDLHLVLENEVASRELYSSALRDLMAKEKISHKDIEILLQRNDDALSVAKKNEQISRHNVRHIWIYLFNMLIFS